MKIKVKKGSKSTKTFDKEKVTVKKQVKSKVLDDLAEKIKETEEAKKELSDKLDILYREYAEEKYKDFKIGDIYSYTEQGKEIKGILIIKANATEHHFPLRLQLIKKDGTMGTQIRIVYRVENLKYVGGK